MKTYLDCIACFVRQAVDCAKLATDDEKIQEKIVRQALSAAKNADMEQVPPVMVQKIMRMVRELSANPDPHRHIKKISNQIVLDMYPALKKRIEQSKNPLENAVRLACTGNVIDFGIHIKMDKEDIEKHIEQAFSEQIDMQALENFRSAVTKAEKILYLGDNAGEIVLDRLLIEQLPFKKITFAVRGGPIINDVLMEDAMMTGITGLVDVIDNGSDSPGVLFGDCSEKFCKVFEASDMIIAKGQGNYESLSEVNKNIFFLLKAKCSVIASHLNCSVGNLILRQHKLQQQNNSDEN